MIFYERHSFKIFHDFLCQHFCANCRIHTQQNIILSRTSPDLQYFQSLIQQTEGSVADPEWFIPFPALNFQSSGSGSRFGFGSNPYYIRIIGEKNLNTLNSIRKKNLPIICHFLFQSTGTVLQCTQSRTPRPKIKNKIIYWTINFLKVILRQLLQVFQN